MPISYKNKIYTTLGTPTVLSGDVVSATDNAGVPTKDYTVKGKTLVWNQIVDKSEYPATTTKNGVTLTNNGDGSITANGTATSDVWFNVMPGTQFPLQIGHKMLLIGCPDGGDLSKYLMRLSDSNDDVGDGKIFSANNSVLVLYIYIKSNYTANNLVFKPQLFDLTQMFGAGNEPSTPAEFKAMFLDDYYPYNAGELKTIAPTSVEASGVERFQLMDKSKYPETTTTNGVTFTNNGDGTITVNGTAGSTVGIWHRLKNDTEIPVGHKVLISGGVTGAGWSSYLFYDDSDATYGIDRPGGGKIYTVKFSPIKPMIFIAKGYTVSNVVFKPQLFDLTKMFGVGNEPTTVAEFWQKVSEKLYGYNPNDYKSVNIPSSKYFPDGMRSAGSAYDEINFLSQKAIKRIGVVDLGTLNWSYAASRNVFQTNDLNNFIQWPIGSDYKANMLCSKYTAVSYNDGWNSSVDKICGATWKTGAHWCYIRDTAYTSADAFKAAMSGVMLYYELATPVETAITPPLQALSTYKGFTSFSAPNSLMQNGPLSVTYYAEGGSNPESGWLTSYKRKLYMGRNIEWNQQRPTSTISGSGLTQSLYGNIGVVSTNVIYEHKYYVSLYIKYAIGNTNTSSMVFKMGNFGKDEFVINMKPTESWNRYEKIETLKSLSTPSYLSGFMKLSSTEQTLSIEWKDIQIFDLTQMFGAGNEPATPEEFWSYFDHKLYLYNAGETRPLFKISRKSR